MMMRNSNYKTDFPLLRNTDFAYLDNAATSQKPQLVIDAVSEFYSTSNANVHRGLYVLAERATAAYETTRDTVQSFINAASRKEIIFTSGTTAGINLVASSFGEKYIATGDIILLSPTEHHSNIVPWQLLAKRTGAIIEWFDLTAEGTIDESTLPDKIHANVKIIAVAHIANGSGTVNPVEKIIGIAKTYSIPVLIDAAQSVPHRPVDVLALQCDFLVFSAHKLCGPTGVGVLYAKQRWLESMEPWQGGGDMIETVGRQQSTWAELPYKFEAGTPNIAGVVGLGAAIRYIQSIGIDAVQEQTEAIYRYLYTQLQKLDYIDIFGSHDIKQRSSIVSFMVKGVHPHDVAQVLDSQNVAIRAGHHCAQILMEYWQVPATCRASLYFYNDTNDVDKLIEGLHNVQKKFS